MKIIVVDTSIFVASLLSKSGASREVLRRCITQQYQPLMGTALFNEYDCLLQREKLFSKCSLSISEREKLLNALMAVCRWVHVYYLWRPNLTDEDDNHIIELAVAGNAHSIITHNEKDFRGGELLFPDLSILTPAELLKEENDNVDTDYSIAKR